MGYWLERARALAKEEHMSPPAVKTDRPTDPGYPTCPLRPGWTVAYRDSLGVLRHGRVVRVESERGGWRVTTEDGGTVHSSRIVSVNDGQRAWTVKAHGLDGHRGEPKQHVCPVCERTILTTHDLSDQDGQCSSCWAHRWHRGFQAIAQLVHGIRREDSRFDQLDQLLDACDAAFLNDDFPAFQEAAEQVRKVIDDPSN